MDEQLLYQRTLRDQASLAKALTRTLGVAPRGVAETLRPTPSAIQQKQLVRMRTFLVDSAEGSGAGTNVRLVADPASARPRSHVERRSIFELVRRLVPEAETTPAVLNWLKQASEVLEAVQASGLGGLDDQQRDFLRDKLAPFLQKLSNVDQDYVAEWRGGGLARRGR